MTRHRRRPPTGPSPRRSTALCLSATSAIALTVATSSMALAASPAVNGTGNAAPSLRAATSRTPLVLSGLRLGNVVLIDARRLAKNNGYAGRTTSEVVPSLTATLGHPEVFTADLCPGLPAPDRMPSVAVYKWGDLSVVFTGTTASDHFLELVYNLGGWNAQNDSRSPQAPTTETSTNPRVIGPDQIVLGETLRTVLTSHPPLRAELHGNTIYVGQVQVKLSSANSAGSAPIQARRVTELYLPSNWNC